MTCITLTSPNLYCKCLSINSSATLVTYDNNFVADVLSDDDASDADDCEPFSGERIVHESRKERALEPPMLDILIAKMTALALDNPPRHSKLRPLISNHNNHKTSTTIHCPPLFEPAYSVDALVRRVALPGPSFPIDVVTGKMEAMSLEDCPFSISEVKPLILVTKRTIRHFKLPSLTTTLLRQPKPETTTQSQTYWPFSLISTIWARLRFDVRSPMTNPDDGFLSPATRFTAKEAKSYFQSTRTTPRRKSLRSEVPPTTQSRRHSNRPSLLFPPMRYYITAMVMHTWAYQSKSLLISFSTTSSICTLLDW
ncbi:hypothetical protein BDR06DRAFT_1008503 [Suillus hirtellus]|nr:hypothetical protein BDR06DRAFT_1008503 [Suillus hirtellus]